MFGREVIYTHETEITEHNVVEVLNDAYQIHRFNSADIDYLYNYYRGKQPVLQRTKTVRPEDKQPYCGKPCAGNSGV